MKMVLRSVKLFLAIMSLLLCVGLVPSLQTLEFVVLNDASEMAKTKKIMLKVDFSPGEKWAYREMFRFSSNNPHVALRSWKASVASTSEYIPQFHQAKRVFASPFDIELTFDSPGIEDAALVEQLERATVMVSYVVLTDRHKHNAHTAVVKLVDGAKDVASVRAEGISGLALSMTTTMPGVVADVSVSANRHTDDEIIYLVRGATFYDQVHDLVVKIRDACAPLFVSIIFVLVLLLMSIRFLMRSRPRLAQYYPTSFSHAVFALTPPAVIYLIGKVISAGLASILLGGYLLVLGCYLVITQHDQPRTFKVKSLLLLGGIFIVMALPLVIKGIVLFYF